MTTFFHAPHYARPSHMPQRPARPAALAMLGRALRAALSAWQRRRMAQAALHTLQGLDGHTLRDLGLDRSELASLAHLPDDPTRARAHGSC